MREDLGMSVEGVTVEVDDDAGTARVAFLGADQRRAYLPRLTAGGVLSVDTRSGPRRVYIVPVRVARDAGLLGEPDPVDVPVPAPLVTPARRKRGRPKASAPAAD